jgi:hypothetical protein
MNDMDKTALQIQREESKALQLKEAHESFPEEYDHVLQRCINAALGGEKGVFLCNIHPLNLRDIQWLLREDGLRVEIRFQPITERISKGHYYLDVSWE